MENLDFQPNVRNPQKPWESQKSGRTPAPRRRLKRRKRHCKEREYVGITLRKHRRRPGPRRQKFRRRHAGFFFWGGVPPPHVHSVKSWVFRPWTGVGNGRVHRVPPHLARGDVSASCRNAVPGHFRDLKREEIKETDTQFSDKFAKSPNSHHQKTTDLPHP